MHILQQHLLLVSDIANINITALIAKRLLCHIVERQ